MNAATTPSTALEITTIGGPTAVLAYGGVRFITDPTFDPPGSYEPRPGITLTKVSGPALRADEVGEVDVVLLSHDHHKDNLDDSGRDFLVGVSRVLTTKAGAERLGAMATAVPNWTKIDIERPSAEPIHVMGLPAQHGPDGSEHLVGEVTGFLLSGEGLPSVYVSGDNASLDVVRTIADRVGTIDVAVLFAGGAQMPYLGDAYLTLSSVATAQAAQLLGARAVVPLHFADWTHFSDGLESLRQAFAAADISQRLIVVDPGQTVSVSGRL